ncbi:hypothetical protein [Nocardia lijiangensis]|nr:hypothetical protein [Nocardia lijiangensis]
MAAQSTDVGAQGELDSRRTRTVWGPVGDRCGADRTHVRHGRTRNV